MSGGNIFTFKRQRSVGPFTYATFDAIFVVLFLKNATWVASINLRQFQGNLVLMCSVYFSFPPIATKLNEVSNICSKPLHRIATHCIEITVSLHFL